MLGILIIVASTILTAIVFFGLTNLEKGAFDETDV